MACELQGKVVVVFGGAGLLGKEFIKAIVHNGGFGVSVDIEKRSAVKADVTSSKQIDAAFDSTRKKFGKVDAVVISAYPKNKNYGRKFEDVRYEDFCDNLNKHLGGYFLVSQRAVRYFKKQGYGNIVNIGSVYGVIAPRFEIYQGVKFTMPVEYAAIKAGILHLTKYLAKYCKGFNIRANAISPGGILNSQPDKFLREYRKLCLSKGMLTPSDLTGALVFLLGDNAKYINGQNIIIDDGFSL